MRTASSRGAVLVVALAAAGVSPQAAQEHESEAAHHHRHEVALFVGATYEADNAKHFATLGGEYEFRIHPRLGIGAGLEYLFDVDAAVLVFPFTFHLGAGVSLLAGPGVEVEPRHVPENAGPLRSGHDQGRDEQHYLTRVGGQYAIEVEGRYSVVPFVAIDFVHRGARISKALVYGAKLAVGF